MDDKQTESAIEKPASLLLRIAEDAVSESASAPAAAITAIVFSAIWLEAYFNQLVEVIDFRVSAGVERIPQGVQQAIEEQRQLEEAKRQLPEKLAKFVASVSGNKQDRGTSPYQELQLLVALRDSLVHSWPTRVRRGATDDNLTLSRSSARNPDVRALINRLAERGVLAKKYASTNPPLVEALTRPGVARWSLDTAQAVAALVANSFPTEGMRLWANRENHLSGAPPRKIYQSPSGITFLLPD